MVVRKDESFSTVPSEQHYIISINFNAPPSMGVRAKPVGDGVISRLQINKDSFCL
jgi:hypothetical protein